VGVFDRFLASLSGRGREVRAAQRAELRGELEQAAELYGLAGAPEEAARIMILRGDAETDMRARMRHYTQAVATAPDGHAVRDAARRKRASLLLAQFGGVALSEGARRELRSAGEELLAVGDAAAAAEAFKLAGDTEGEANALQQAGDVESLEVLLTEQQRKERAERERTEVHREIDLLVSSGRRREAVARADAWLASHEDPSLRDRAATLQARKAIGPILDVWLRGKPVTLVLGDEVVIGRTEGTLRVSSQAVSRQHVRIRREGGGVVVRDLETRNGTQLRGMSLRGAIPVPAEGGLDFTLGKEVRMHLAASDVVEGGVAIELAGATYVATLGPARPPGVPWQIVLGPDEWAELAPSDAPPFLGDMRLADRTTLLVGDSLTSERGGSEILRVVGRERQ
jgi:hypothetical protein